MRPVILLICGLALLSGCGSNVFEPIAKSDPSEAAVAAMDEDDPDEAINILEKALESAPDNWELLSLMASAKAQKAGIDTTDIALRMAGNNEEASGNALTSLFAILPVASSENVQLLLEAVTFINRIPPTERVAADNFKLSMYNTAYTALQAKLLDIDGDGRFTTEELADLDEAAAASILGSLVNAETAAAGYSSGDTTGRAASRIADIRVQIAAQPGATQAERLRSFLGTSAPAGNSASP